MTRYLTFGTWRILRALTRKSSLTGRALRLFDYGVRSKSGAFLDKLVASGLIRAVKTNPDDTPPGKRPKPVQFRTQYELTALGVEAAEYGLYQVPDRKSEPVPEPVKKTPRKPKSK